MALSPQRWRTRHGLLALVCLATAVRLAAVGAVGSYRLDHVTYEHGEIARSLVEGRGFSAQWMGATGPTSQQAPVYPFLVAVFYALGGIGPSAILALQAFQALLGGLLAAVVVRLAWELLPHERSIGWIAGIATAWYPTLVYMATQVQVASVAALLTATVLTAALAAARTRSRTLAAACGGAGGLLILTDPILGLVVAVALAVLGLAWIRQRAAAVFRRGPGPSEPEACAQSRVHVVLAFALVAAVVFPWMVRNRRVHGEWVPVKSTFGYAFWQGNHPRSFGTDKIPLPASPPRGVASGGVRGLEQKLWHARLIDTLYIDDAVLSNERIAELGKFPEPERSRQLFAEALGYIAQNPGHYVRLCVQRLQYFLLFDETNPKSKVWVYRASHLLICALALVGLVRTRHQARRLWPTYAVFLAITAFHTLTIVSARFHIPLEPLLLVWGASAVPRTVWQRVWVGFHAALVARSGRAELSSSAATGSVLP